MIRATWHSLAKRELFESLDFYERRAAGLGEILLSSIEDAVAQVRRNPRSSPVVLGEIRRRGIHRFPYSIVYRLEEDRIFILAVAHQKRRPRYWARRT